MKSGGGRWFPDGMPDYVLTQHPSVISSFGLVLLLLEVVADWAA